MSDRNWITRQSEIAAATRKSWPDWMKRKETGQNTTSKQGSQKVTAAPTSNDKTKITQNT